MGVEFSRKENEKTLTYFKVSHGILLEVTRTPGASKNTSQTQ